MELEGAVEKGRNQMYFAYFYNFSLWKSNILGKLSTENLARKIYELLYQ